MKSKKQIRKFNFEKFEVAKLEILKTIYGGTGVNGDTATNDRPGNSSQPCVISRNSNPPCKPIDTSISG